MIITAGSMAGGRQAGGVSECLPLTHKQEAEKVTVGLVWAFETLEPTLSDTPPLTRTCLLILLK